MLNGVLQTAKFLMSNTAAGSIIGKGGANINELQRKSGAKLQLSRPSEFFPGTNDRVLSGTGSIHQLGTALDLILTACQDDAVCLLPAGLDCYCKISSTFQMLTQCCSFSMPFFDLVHILQASSNGHLGLIHVLQILITGHFQL